MISSELKSICDDVLAALAHERQAILTRPSKLSSRCFDGRLLSGRPGAYTYRFALENDLELLAGLPILLTAGERSTRGHIQTMKGSEVQVVVEENLGEAVVDGDLLVLENLLIDQLIKLIEHTRDGRRGHYQEEMARRLFGIDPAEVAETTELEIPPAEKELLNEHQLRAMRCGGASNLLLLCGPTGTGKTRTIAALAAHLAAMGERILLVSHSPSGCDRALDQFYTTLSQTAEPPPGSILRLGPAEALLEQTEAAVSLYAAAENSLSEVMRPSYLLDLRDAHRARLQQIRAELGPIDLRSTTSKVLQSAEAAIQEIRAQADALAEVFAEIENQVKENESKKAPAIQFLGEWGASPVLDRSRKSILNALKAEGMKLPYPDDVATLDVQAPHPEDDVTVLLNHARELAHAYPACKPSVETIEMLHSQMELLHRALPVARVLHRTAENSLLADSLVIGTTVTRGCLSPVVFDGEFDTVIFDEAHRISIPSLLALAGLAKSRVVLSGDFRMPPHSSRTSQVLPICRRVWAQDIFDWSGVRAAVDEGKPVPALVFLDCHYRDHADLTPWQGDLFYGKKIRDGAKSRAALEPLTVPWAKDPVVLVDSSGLEPRVGKAVGRSSRINLTHAAGVSHIVNDLLDGGYDPEGIAVVVPGEAQLKAIQKLLWHDNLTSVLVATLQQFQNTDRDVVIFDLPDGPPHEITRSLSGHEDDLARRLLNVPMSRARRQVIFLAHLPYVKERLDPKSQLRRLFDKIEAASPVVPLADIVKNTPEALKVWCDTAAAGWSAQRMEQDIQDTDGDLFFWTPMADLAAVKKLGERLSRCKTDRTAYIFTTGRDLRSATGEAMTPAEFARGLFGHAALPHIRFVLTAHDMGPLALIGQSVVWTTPQSMLDERVRRMGFTRLEAPELGRELYRIFQVPQLLTKVAKLHERMALPICQTCHEPLRWSAVEGLLQSYCGCTQTETWKTQELAQTLTGMSATCPRCASDLVSEPASGPMAMVCATAGCGFSVGKVVPAPAKTKRRPPAPKKAGKSAEAADDAKQATVGTEGSAEA